MGANYFGPVKGIINHKEATKTFPTPRGEFKVRNIRIEIKETGRDGKEYSTIPEFKLINDLTSVVDYNGFEVGKEVEFYFSINGREMKWNDKNTGEPKSAWRSEITCLKIKALSEQTDVIAPDAKAQSWDIPQGQLERMLEAKKAAAAAGTGSSVGQPQAQAAPYSPQIDDDSSDLPF